ncbi:AraC family transcriptional regulator [Clostridium oceanicum]|uniref:AraC family transcriptional regulator n=1 Tax=Clostridium oceanicum TaxID=1543 RepID=A0ABP3UN99_9CLOT
MKEEKNVHEELLLKSGFTKLKNCSKYNSIGTCYKLDPTIGVGYFWIYSYKNLFSIVIHDFYFHEDFYFESSLSKYFSISYFESVSGEELNPYHRLNAGCVKSYWCNGSKYNALFHKNIPIKSIGIEFMPEYCNEFLENKFSDEYIDPKLALISIDETTDFPEMVFLLHQILNYKGNGISAKLFYEGKISEAMALIYEKYKEHKKNHSTLCNDDIEHLKNVTSYINDHYAHELTLSKLSKIACMGTTKFKKTFKELYKCTTTQYIQHRRMGQAEHLLADTDLIIGQVSQIVGYKSASRFSELFKKSTGLSPVQYRKLSRRC